MLELPAVSPSISKGKKNLKCSYYTQQIFINLDTPLWLALLFSRTLALET